MEGRKAHAPARPGPAQVRRKEQTMPKRPFLVLPGGDCVPLEGDWRIARLRGDWYVLGHNSVVPCGSRRAAESMLDELAERTDVDHLAREAIEAFDTRLLQSGIDPA